MYTYNANISEKLYSNWLELTDDKVLTELPKLHSIWIKNLSNLNIYISMPHVLWWSCEYDRKKFKVLCGNARLEVKEDEGEEA